MSSSLITTYKSIVNISTSSVTTLLFYPLPKYKTLKNNPFFFLLFPFLFYQLFYFYLLLLPLNYLHLFFFTDLLNLVKNRRLRSELFFILFNLERYSIPQRFLQHCITNSNISFIGVLVSTRSDEKVTILFLPNISLRYLHILFISFLPLRN